MAKGPKPPKTHGLSHGPNLHQIVSYILLSSKIFIFQHFIASNFVMSIQVVLSFVYYAANIVVIVCGVLATICDPTDEIVKLERKSRLEGLPFETSRYEFHCEFCGTSVSHSDTKHCRSCGRCVDGFDHHCEWVNNCISKKNYRPFATLIGGLGVSTLTYVVSGLMFCVDFFSGKLQVVEDLEAVKDDLGEWQIYLIIVYTVINLVLFLLDCKLISFHLYLYKHNITTYQYIVEGREKQREKTSKKRSSLTMNKGKGKGTQKSSSAERDVEDIKDVSLHEQDKKLGEKVRLVGSVPMNRLNYRSQDNFEEAYSNDAKLGFSGNSSNAPFMMSLDKSAKVSDRSNYNHDSPKKQLISREYPYHIDFKAEAQAKQQDELSEAVNSNNGRFLSPSNMSSQLTPTQVPTSFQNFSSPSNGLLANASFPDIPQPERKDSRDFDETEPPTSAKGEGLESRQVAFSIARIADNYVPKYGKISEEEENENELPNVSDPVQEYEGKGI